MPGAQAAEEADPYPIVTKISDVQLPKAGDSGKKAYLATYDAKDADKISALGIDRVETPTSVAGDGKLKSELILSEAEAAKLGKNGVALEVRSSSQSKAGARSSVAAAGVYKHYAGEGGLAEELLSVANANPDITKLVSIGKTHLGQDILAIKVSTEAKTARDGTKAPVLYMSNQHAREWITPEMNRRLLHHYVNGYNAGDPEIKQIVDETELWFVLSANPDGYEWTFQPDQRLWRKNLRDNDGNGVISGADGVDPNRNFPYKWGYDNEGSSPDPFNDTYRGPGPGSEPETKAIDGLMDRIDPRFVVNYHSAAQLLLYGVGWQVSTPSPDDQIMSALAGTPANPAVPGFVPQLGASLYATNGDTDGHADSVRGSLAFTPEMSTCETASAWDPNDAWDPADCESIFSFPDDETLIQREFANNIPFAVSVAKSAWEPDEPVSSVGMSAKDLVVHKFGTSYAEKGDSQEIALDAKKKLTDVKINYKVNGGKVKTDGVLGYYGGERYGDDGLNWYKSYRANVKNNKPGDSVEVWFTAKKPGKGKVESEHFTYTVATGVEQGAEVLVLANEDYKGVNPTYPAGTNAPKYAEEYLAAVRSTGTKAAFWDVDKQGVPDALGVLGHFKAVVWYLGDNRLTMDAADELTRVGNQYVPDSTVADRAFELTMNVRDYLNDGGKLVYAGETTAYYGPLSGANGGGIYYGLKGAPDQPCRITTSFRDDCEILSDDFTQYYLGVYGRGSVNGVNGVTGTQAPLAGVNAGLPGTASNPVNEAGGFLTTSTVLPPGQFPQFTSRPVAEYAGVPSGPYTPYTGSKYIAGPHQDDSYMRLTRTIDLTGVTAADAAKLTAQMSWDTEESYDNVIVEAHTVGQDDWTTLPDLNGRSSTAVPAECSAGFYVGGHPHLAHYLTVGTPCAPTGTSGAWNAFTANSGGWQEVAFDLSAYAGKQIEVSISYVTDPGSGGVGLFIDEAKLVKNGTAVETEGFENGLGPWTLAGAPPGDHSPAAFLHTNAVFGNSVIATEDSVVFGFGIEQLATQADKNAVLGRAVNYLLGK
ncbi:M14 family metallopeptidase [Yinghuangia soli]|uniref:Immune inhibitor A n=1 Tax=Yinghuangia soli TaxID=2908204 RepID=A0AA41Q367_9ACTN|nr:M14 family metallopeptidase [Yinghuangia soli]MCF2530471.1 immune inhibitor A [Yinghuangia soli]